MGNAETKEEDHPVVTSYVRDEYIKFQATPLQLETAQSFVDTLIENGVKVLNPVVVSPDESFLAHANYHVFKKSNDACFGFMLKHAVEERNLKKMCKQFCFLLSIPRYQMDCMIPDTDIYFIVSMKGLTPIHYNKRIKHLEELVEHQQGQIVELSNKLNEATDRVNDMWYHELMPGGQLQLKKAKEGFFGNE